MKNKVFRRFIVQAAILLIFIYLLSGLSVTFFSIPNMGTNSIAFIVIVYIIGLFVVYRLDEDKLKKLDFYPQDFIERDEREAIITAKAARKSFIILDYVFIAGSILAMFAASFANIQLKTGFRTISLSLLVSYLIMHIVFLLTFRKENI